MAHVLIVDDNELVRDALRKAVVALGHTVASTCDMVQALDLAANQRPDLLVLDADMIFVDELLGSLAELLGDTWPPLLFTAFGPAPALPPPAIAAGVSGGLLRKPFTLRAFHEAVEAALAATS